MGKVLLKSFSALLYCSSHLQENLEGSYPTRRIYKYWLVESETKEQSKTNAFSLPQSPLARA